MVYSAINLKNNFINWNK